MSKSRKILGAILAVVMVLSVVSVSAFAAGATGWETNTTYTQDWSLTNLTNVSGSQYKVDVVLSANYYVGPVSFRLEGVSSIDDVQVGAGYYAGANIERSNSGLIFMVPDTSDTVSGKACDNAVIATVTFTAAAANGAVSIEKSVKHAGNPEGSLVAARLTEATVNDSDLIVGQTATIGGELVFEVEEEPSAPTTATLTGVNGGFVDETRGYVYGVPASTANPTTYFSTTGYVEMVANSAGAINGTGATLNLYTDSSKATLVKSYKLVIFGDVTGDGAVNLQDAGIVQTSANFVTDPLTDCYFFAADVDCNNAVNLQDAGAVQTAANFVTDPISANPWAA